MKTGPRTGALSPTALIDALEGVTVPGQFDDFVESLSWRHPTALRLRRGIDASHLPMPTKPVSWYDLGRQPTDPDCKPSSSLMYAVADYYLQDAGSMLALAAIDADSSSLSDKMICDLCAAPGGKASALVEAVDRGTGFVLANEVIRSRIGALQSNLARTGSDRYAVSNLDPDLLAHRLPGVFDVVVVDAPCSGQALIARGKQSRSSLSAKQIRHSASRQHRIVDAAIGLLREGGRLIYSTCTFATAENEAQMQRLINAGIARPHASERLAAMQSDGGVMACYRLWPHLDRCAGSFAASMSVTTAASPAARRWRRGDTRLPLDLSEWLDNLEGIRCEVRESTIIGWPDDAPSWVDEIAIGGPELAHRAGQTWKPSHAAALRRVALGTPRQRAQIDDTLTCAMLRGEPIALQQTGWQVALWQGRPIGWLKGDGRMAKNHVPKSVIRSHASAASSSP